jgi:hypothetical protein
LEDVAPNRVVRGILLLLHVAGLVVAIVEACCGELRAAIYEVEEGLGAWR